MSQSQPSKWQKSIEGQWYGTPAVFNAEGTRVGRMKVDRSSVFENGRTTYFMDTDLDFDGPLRARFEAENFAFGVIDSDQDRVYMGPDFMGSGRPYGTLVDAHYYSPGWRADLKTMVHILPDGETQVYSSLLYDGPTIVAVFNGIYKVATDYGKNPETTAAIDKHLERERKVQGRPHVLPLKKAGRWVGEMTVYGADQKQVGTSEVEIKYTPTSLTGAKVETHVSGPVELHASYHRTRMGNRHVFEGPEVYGNGISYGRALYTTQHVYGKALRIQGREFIIDDDHSMSVVWQVEGSGKLQHMMFGKLRFEPGELVLPARY